MTYDVAIIGGGPAGLSAALTLGRARRRVLLSDSGPRRNARATNIHNFVTQDGTPPERFRQIAREQLALYPSVDIRDAPVRAVEGVREAFRVHVGEAWIEARRILVCTGMIDEMLPIEGFEALWGHAIFQCPHCHGWENQDRRWGFLALGSEPVAAFAMQLRGWTNDVVVFSTDPPPEGRERLLAAGIRLETSPVVRLVSRGRALEAVELEDGTRVPCDVLFTHPPQRQVELVSRIGVALDEGGYIVTDPMTLATSVPGIYAAGDLTRVQGTLVAAAAGLRAASMINVDLAFAPSRSEAEPDGGSPNPPS